MKILSFMGLHVFVLFRCRKNARINYNFTGFAPLKNASTAKAYQIVGMILIKIMIR